MIPRRPFTGARRCSAPSQRRTLATDAEVANARQYCIQQLQ
jgi:hypothetical protein